MNLEPKVYVLKNNEEISVRTLAPEEAQKLLDLKRSYIKNTTTIPLHLEEYPDDVTREKEIITTLNESPNSLLLIAEVNKELVGNIDLNGSPRSKMAHTAMIGMGIKEDWRNLGLGKILMEAVIDWARTHSELELIWLDVYGSNLQGIQLYKNTGFKVSGVVKRFFKDENGYADKVQMYMALRSSSE